MRLPIDTSHLTFTCLAPARQVTDYETKRPKADVITGERVFSVMIRVEHTDGENVIRVKVPGNPEVDRGATLALDGLVASPWSIGGRFGVAFRADTIRSVPIAAETNAAGRGQSAA